MSAEYCSRVALRPVFLRLEYCSVSLVDLVGDFDGDLLVGDRDDELEGFLFSLDTLLSERFLEDLERKLGSIGSLFKAG